MSGELASQGFPGTDWMLITVICICLFIGAMGKSAQFPLHVWLPDSMEGPTPISALIHAATMVTAGIFMVARMSPLFELSDTALNFVLVIGAITALFMGFLGIIQNDIKRVVAYSTLSQLGYMTVALGASAYSVAVFHLMTHAFFKALLFLAAGSVIMGVHHNQDIRWMGGLRKYMPITWITSLLGSLALIGTPLFAGFYSKDSIIEAVHFSNLPGAGFAHFAVLAGVFVTAFYSFRMYFLVFHGKERFDQNPDAHHDDHHGQHDTHHPHESPWVVTVPLVLLAIPSVVIGYMTIGPMLFGDFFKDAMFVDAAAHPAMAELAQDLPWPDGDGHPCPDHGAVLAGAGRCRRRRTTCTWSIRRCRRPSRRDLHAALHPAREQVLHGLVQRERAGARRACAGHRSVEGRRSVADRRRARQRLVEARRLGVVRRAPAAVRLPVPLCAVDDSGRVRADDVFRLAQLAV